MFHRGFPALTAAPGCRDPVEIDGLDLRIGRTQLTVLARRHREPHGERDLAGLVRVAEAAAQGPVQGMRFSSRRFSAAHRYARLLKRVLERLGRRAITGRTAGKQSDERIVDRPPPAASRKRLR